MKVALVNTNRMKPAIAPIGLDYLAEATSAAGHQVDILDLCWSDDLSADIARFFNEAEYRLVGITLRNTDDCGFTSRQSFLSEFSEIVKSIRKHTNATLVIGGVGFSTMPEAILEICEADLGIKGEGEFAFPELANRIESNREFADLPNLVLVQNQVLNPASFGHLERLPAMSRSWVDNTRYFKEGGQAGFETKRGCSGRCIYCADPVAKGKGIRVRTPKSVVDELKNLLDMGIDHLHTCDSEFNLPDWHAFQVCDEIINRKLADRLRWYAYCTPHKFSDELARRMYSAGCIGINFGVDNGDDNMLRSLKRDFTASDIINTARSCKKAGIITMFDLLIGAPGETKESIARTIEVMKQAEPDRVGVSVGVRVYPGTELSRQLEGKIDNDNLTEPAFFLEPSIADIVFELLDKLIGDDERFLFFDPSKAEKNYNYNANQILVDAIKEGYRGAYWDILRKYKKETYR